MNILIIEDDLITRDTVKSHLENPGVENTDDDSVHIVTAVSTQKEAEEALEKQAFDCAFIDLKLDEDRFAGYTLLKNIAKNYPRIIPIMMTSNTADRTVEDCLKNGAADYIYKPFEEKTVHQIMRKAKIIHRIRRFSQSLKQNTDVNSSPAIRLTSKNKKFQATIDYINKFRGKSIPMFIHGETGVGKDEVAKYLNLIEEDPLRVFIAVNCSAVSPELIESEFFGYEKGAFSGANDSKIGKFEAAHNGDIFLDEVATMSNDLQTKLLRVLNDKRITPVGSNKTKEVNVRIISATNQNVHALIAEGKFREDLFSRLNAVTFEIPPLRERMEDLEDLVNFFFEHFGYKNKQFTPEAWVILRNHSWPGNIRDLKQLIEVLGAISEGNLITAEEVMANLKKQTTYVSEVPQHNGDLPFGLTKDRIRSQFNAVTEEFEQALVRHAYKEMESVQGAAKYLGISRNSLNYKLKVWGWSLT